MQNQRAEKIGEGISKYNGFRPANRNTIRCFYAHARCAALSGTRAEPTIRRHIRRCEANALDFLTWKNVIKHAFVQIPALVCTITSASCCKLWCRTMMAIRTNQHIAFSSRSWMKVLEIHPNRSLRRDVCPRFHKILDGFEVSILGSKSQWRVPLQTLRNAHRWR